MSLSKDSRRRPCLKRGFLRGPSNEQHGEDDDSHLC